MSVAFLSDRDIVYLYFGANGTSVCSAFREICPPVIFLLAGDLFPNIFLEIFSLVR
jgi:hypothetical protein